MSDRQPTVDELLEMEEFAQGVPTDRLAYHIGLIEAGSVARPLSSFALERLDVYRRELAHREATHAG